MKKQKTLKKLISRYMYRVSGILVISILIILFIGQVLTEQKRACENATRTFTQIGQMLEKNQKELEETRAEYRQTCLHNAETVARIIENDPEVLDSVEELKEIAVSVEVDEIHVFDSTGRIFTGTHPEYYGLTFDSGEQIGFFKQMLNNKKMELVQGITPNTAERKSMQYSAVWSENGQYIVQVGMEPVNVAKVTSKNELSYVFSLFRVNPEANYYAVDVKSGEIVGSTNLKTVGMNISKIGCRIDQIQNDGKGFYARINGELSYCVFTRIGSNLIGRVISVKNLYERTPTTLLGILVSLLVVAFFLVRAVVKYMNRYVVDEISEINDKLKSISDGNLEERIEVNSSAEFEQLSSYINFMVRSLVYNNKKMSYALSQTNLDIGVYEYGMYLRKIHYTEKLPKILSLDSHEMETLSLHVKDFANLINRLKKHPVENEQGVYCYGERFIRLEEIIQNDSVFGVVLDVTSDVTRRMEIEKERDMDVLTGLYNRRGLDVILTQLFEHPENLGCSALVMIDADGLKGINDTYGHEKGDIYLKNIGRFISQKGAGNKVAARQGGDEFVLFLYGYESEAELTGELKALEEAQSDISTALDENISVPLRFSIGYYLVKGEKDYQEILKEADRRMYEDKARRKFMYSGDKILSI